MTSFQKNTDKSGKKKILQETAARKLNTNTQIGMFFCKRDKIDSEKAAGLYQRLIQHKKKREREKNRLFPHKLQHDLTGQSIAHLAA